MRLAARSGTLTSRDRRKLLARVEKLTALNFWKNSELSRYLLRKDGHEFNVFISGRAVSFLLFAIGMLLIKRSKDRPPGG